MNYSKVPDWLLNTSYIIIEHMNEDHSYLIISTLNAQHCIKDKNARMEKLRQNGYSASSNGKLYFLKFEKISNSAEEYKAELINHTKKFRSY